MRTRIAAIAKRIAISYTTREVCCSPLVDFETMTWPEVKQALDQGKTTALIYNGGTEQRGPRNVNGGHTLMAASQWSTTATRIFVLAEPRAVSKRFAHDREFAATGNLAGNVENARRRSRRVTAFRKLDFPSFQWLTRKYPTRPLDTVVRLGQKEGKPRLSKQ